MHRQCSSVQKVFELYAVAAVHAHVKTNERTSERTNEQMRTTKQFSCNKQRLYPHTQFSLITSTPPLINQSTILVFAAVVGECMVIV